MSDWYVADNFDVPLEDANADTLLAWARSIESAAEPEAVYRRKEGRATVRFEQQGRGFFLKRHTGVGWREIVKNLLSLRLPVTSAANEFRALNRLAQIGLPAPRVVAYAKSGANPARCQSMIVTAELPAAVSLEQYCGDWKTAPPPFVVRQRIVRLLANIARRLHEAGINHRDFYLCHFHIEQETLAQSEPRAYLIDLHRAHVRARVPDRWREKDLAGLYFSAMDCGLTRRDLLRFMRHYEPGGLRQALGESASRWHRVTKRARKMYLRDQGSAVSMRELLQ